MLFSRNRSKTCSSRRVRTRREPFANPSRTGANPSRTCANLRELARIRECVANPRMRRQLARICRECVENFRESFANPCKPSRELPRIRREFANICAKSLRIWRECASEVGAVSPVVTRSMNTALTQFRHRTIPPTEHGSWRSFPHTVLRATPVATRPPHTRPKVPQRQPAAARSRRLSPPATPTAVPCAAPLDSSAQQSGFDCLLQWHSSLHSNAVQLSPPCSLKPRGTWQGPHRSRGEGQP
jgi:hypothetical protein